MDPWPVEQTIPDEVSVATGLSPFDTEKGNVNSSASCDTSSEAKLDTESKVITPHKEWIDSRRLGPYTNQYDDMLWFYKYYYELIQKTYRERTDGREFTLKHKKDYVRYVTEEDDQTVTCTSLSTSTAAAAIITSGAVTAGAAGMTGASTTEATSSSSPLSS